MASIIETLAQAKTHAKTATMPTILGVVSGVLGIVSEFSKYIILFQTLFITIIIIVLIFVKSKEVVSPDTSKGLIGWLSASVSGLIVCTAFVLIAPTPESPVNLVQLDPHADPCLQVVAYGFRCTAEDFQEAMNSGNRAVIKIFAKTDLPVDARYADEAIKDVYVKAALDGGKLVNSPDSCKFEAAGIEGHSTLACAFIRDNSLKCALKRAGMADQSFFKAITDKQREFRKSLLDEYPKVTDPHTCTAMTGYLHFKLLDTGIWWGEPNQEVLVRGMRGCLSTATCPYLTQVCRQ